MPKRRSPAVDAVKGNGDVKLNEPIRLSTGIMVKLIPVPAAVIMEAQGEIEAPQPPTQAIEGKPGVEMPNLQHPDYIAAQRRYLTDVANAGFDVMALLGVELIGGMPDNDEWLDKLKFLEKLKRLDLTAYDLDIPIEREFVYKRFYAMAKDDWELLSILSGVTQEEIEKAKDTFQGN